MLDDGLRDEVLQMALSTDEISEALSELSTTPTPYRQKQGADSLPNYLLGQWESLQSFCQEEQTAYASAAHRYQEMRRTKLEALAGTQAYQERRAAAELATRAIRDSQEAVNRIRRAKEDLENRKQSLKIKELSEELDHMAADISPGEIAAVEGESSTDRRPARQRRRCRDYAMRARSWLGRVSEGSDSIVTIDNQIKESEKRMREAISAQQAEVKRATEILSTIRRLDGLDNAAIDEQDELVEAENLATTSRQVLLEALLEKAVLPLTREWINDRIARDRQRLYRTVFDTPVTSGLRQMTAQEHEVPTIAFHRLRETMRGLGGGAIGISGPRGIGKSTLIRSACNDADWLDSGMPALGVVVSAPVAYVPREFIIHLFATVLLKAAPDAGDDITKADLGKESNIYYRLLALAAVVSIVGISMVASALPPDSLSPSDSAGMGFLIVLCVAVLVSMADLLVWPPRTAAPAVKERNRRESDKERNRRESDLISRSVLRRGVRTIRRHRRAVRGRAAFDIADAQIHLDRADTLRTDDTYSRPADSAGRAQRYIGIFRNVLAVVLSAAVTLIVLNAELAPTAAVDYYFSTLQVGIVYMVCGGLLLSTLGLISDLTVAVCGFCGSAAVSAVGVLVGHGVEYERAFATATLLASVLLGMVASIAQIKMHSYLAAAVSRVAAYSSVAAIATGAAQLSSIATEAPIDPRVAVGGVILAMGASFGREGWRAIFLTPDDARSAGRGHAPAEYGDLLRDIRFQQTLTRGWSDVMKIGNSLGVSVAGESTTSAGESLSRFPMTYPELVAKFHEFARWCTRKGRSLIIGIDELDKLDVESAHRFMNDVKAIFDGSVPRCYYLVSVSEEAIAGFQQRGLRARDVFDTAFDDMMRVDHLTLDGTIAMLGRRVIDLPYGVSMLCHVLSGGLPRDVVRTIRIVVAARTVHKSSELSELAPIACGECLKTRLDGLRTTIERFPAELWDIIAWSNRLSIFDPATIRVPDRLEERIKQASILREPEVLVILHACSYLHLLTISQFYATASSSDFTRLEAETGAAGLETLARARNRIGPASWPAGLQSILDFREAWEMAPLSEGAKWLIDIANDKQF